MASRLMTAWCVGTALIISATTALGQTRPAAPAAPQPAANPAVQTSPVAPRTSSMGNARVGSPILTRDELRACFKQRDELNVRVAQIDKDRVALDAERTSIESGADGVRAERAKLEPLRESAAALNVRSKTHQDQLAAWTKAMDDVGSSSSAPAQNRRRELERERAQIQENASTLQAERNQLNARIEGSVSGFNTLLAAHEKRVADWNQRNQVQVERVNQLDATRIQWGTDCGDRRYFEEDEIAIKAGK